MNVVSEFGQQFSLHVPQDCHQRVIRELNAYHIGKETVPLEDDWPSGRKGMPMEKIHTNFARSYQVTLIVQVMEDGTLRLKIGNENS